METDHRITMVGKLFREFEQGSDRACVDIGQEHFLYAGGDGITNDLGLVIIKFREVEMGMGIYQCHDVKIE